MRRSAAWLRSEGFTLIEALLAIFLATVILSALAMMTSQWLRNWNQGFARSQNIDLLAAGLDRLVADLAAAEIVSTGGINDPAVFDGTERSVTFVRTALGPNTSVGLELVRIAETDDDGKGALVRRTAPFAPVGPDSIELAPFSNPVAVIRSPYRVTFSYAGPDRIWRDTWRGNAQLPRAIRITARADTASRPVVVSTSTVIRAELPARCAMAKPDVQCPGAGTPPSGKSTNGLQDP